MTQENPQPNQLLRFVYEFHASFPEFRSSDYQYAGEKALHHHSPVDYIPLSPADYLYRLLLALVVSPDGKCCTPGRCDDVDDDSAGRRFRVDHG